MRKLGSSGRVLAAVGVGCGVFAVATAVQASIPDANGVIHGCYNTSPAHGNPTGALRVVDTARANGNCASWESPLNWNANGGVTGATGATGPVGPTGPKGATGPTGSATSLLAGSSGNALVPAGADDRVGVGVAENSGGGDPYIVMPAAGTLSHLQVDITEVGLTGSSAVFTVLNGGVATSLTCTIPVGGLQDCSDAAHTVSFNEGDHITLQVVNGFAAANFAVGWSVRTS